MKYLKACCNCRRAFSSSSILAGKRQQVPYDLPKYQHDPLGKPIRRPDQVDELAQDDPVWRKRVAETENEEAWRKEFALMAEPPRKGFYEQYGAYDGYGLRNKPRYRLVDGKLEEWKAAGEDWKRSLGLHRPMFRVGSRVEVPGFQHRKSPRLTRGLPPTKFLNAPRSKVTQTERSPPPHMQSRQYSTTVTEKPRRGLAAKADEQSTDDAHAPSPTDLRRDTAWRPSKKLSYPAMAGLRELHKTDPVLYNRAWLSKKFGISFEAVSRILKSNWRERNNRVKAATPASQLSQEKKTIVGSKWDTNPGTSPMSPASLIAKMRQ